ncbi:papain family cysteine protease [lymphocystis disease virus-China]|uniref:Papain family cysteine protease n=2 Tax=Lymphocystis disease virus 2 TaxID=159183 RepID=A0A6F8X3I9_9VIRU|nr:papain family cysteine protease [lymphocystis disease virus-China]AAU11066.1 papain family cysteine protease [lymphocystis disease virus-China]BCB67543.1 papain family cysteine protease [Lymphocystis disease virus 2]
MYTPRLASDVRFDKYADYYRSKKRMKDGKFLYTTVTAESKDFPKQFSWALQYNPKTDPPNTLNKKYYIETMRKQYMCGSCWATSLAQVVSDCLIVGEAVAGRKPMISATYIMSENLTQKGCLGGNPAEAAKVIEQRGTFDQTCVDYSWCSEDPRCRHNSLGHFSARETAKILNSKIPPFGKCYFGSIPKYLYKINPGSRVLSMNHEGMDHLVQTKRILTFRSTVQAHILKYGPVLGGFVVLTNFMNAEHTNPLNSTRGIYFENIAYNHNRIDHAYTKEHSFAVIGMHAVAVVGWGVERNIIYAGRKLNAVYYWHCRNTWGTEWGYQKGYFKIAAYPINKLSQFDTEVSLPDDPFVKIGSVLMIKATIPPRLIDSKGMSTVELNKIKLSHPKRFYMLNESKTSLEIILYVTMVVIFFIVIIVLYLSRS